MPVRRVYSPEPVPVPGLVLGVVWTLATVLVLAWIALLGALVWAGWNFAVWVLS